MAVLHQPTITLWLLLAVFICNQWSRYSIVYLGGVATPTCPGKSSGDPCFFPSGVDKEPPLCDSYECSSEQCKICQACYAQEDAARRNLKYGTCVDSTQYGWLVSYGYMAVFCVMSLFAGRMADLYNRRNLIVTACAVWSGFIMLQGASDNFLTLLIARAGMAFAHAFSGPASLSMIADLFAPEERASANGVYMFGIFMGGGLSSLSILFATQMGWRAASVLIGAHGILASILLLFFVPEPKYQIFLDDEEDMPSSAAMDDAGADMALLPSNSSASYQTGSNEDAAAVPISRPVKEYMSLRSALRIVASDRAVLLLFIAAPARFLGGLAIGTFLPQYFNRRFPMQTNLYSTLNAVIVSVGGATSSYMGGYLTDWWKKSNRKAPAYISALSALLAMVPFIGVMYTNNFYISMGSLLLEYLLAEGWFGPAISIIQERIPVEARGVTISIYLFTSGIIGSIAPVLLGSLDDGASWESLRGNLVLLVSVSYISTFCIFMLLSTLLNENANNPLA